MGILSKLFGSKQPPQEQALLVHLDAVGLPDAVYEENDLASLEDQIEEALSVGALGLVDGHELGEREAVIYLYGPNAEAMFSRVGSILREHPLCVGARVVIRQGQPGASQREVRIEAV